MVSGAYTFPPTVGMGRTEAAGQNLALLVGAHGLSGMPNLDSAF